MRPTFMMLAAALWVAPALAGQVHVEDGAKAIPAEQAAALRLDGSRWPFDLRVKTGAFPSKEALSQAAGACVDRPDVVCVGVDPFRHETVVRFGTRVGVSPGDFDAVAAAATPGLRAGDWHAGMAAVADEAARRRKMPVRPSPAPDVGVVILAAVISMITANGAWIAVRERRRRSMRLSRLTEGHTGPEGSPKSPARC